MSTPLPSRWQRMEALFLAALELPVSERKPYLLEACPDDPALRSEVEGLLARDSEEGATLGFIVEDAASEVVSDDLIGRRLGVYRVKSELGRGGMGTVYLAIRDDHQFRKKVAIKIIRRGLDTDDVLRRFRHERQILANLDHPNIARLLDGGVTPDGRPYLVMEYVEGQPVHIYCRVNNLPVSKKLDLFLQVCDAVSYAHRNLVVHRDLKPGNIVVTENGTVKLLDFGIAKLLHSSTGDSHTQTVTHATSRMFTPDYASPEQLMGMPVNTSTDIYSLGVVLYELLTAKRPHNLKLFTADELERQICQVEPARPSVAVTDDTAAAALSGDLDNIILMALRKEAARRYGSVDQLAADLRRSMAGLPVIAREDTVRYRTGKFVRRHKLGVLASSIAILSLIGGAAIAMNKASEARRERATADGARIIADRERTRAQQEALAARLARSDMERANGEALVARDAALREGKRSQDRLHQMIGLVNKAVYDMHEELAALPGATEVRRNLISTALQYLDSVSREAGSDAFVIGSLASAYYKLGDVQGRPNFPSLGDFTAAMASYRKAEELNDGQLRNQPHNSSLVLNSVRIQSRIASLLRELGKSAEALERGNRALKLMQTIRDPEATAALLQESSDVHYSLSMLNGSTNERKGLHHSRMAFAYSARLLALDPDNPAYLRNHATSYSRIGSGLYQLRQTRQAFVNFQQSLDLRLRVLQTHPKDMLVLREAMLSYGKLGDCLGGPFNRHNLGDDTGALQHYKKAVWYAETIASFDPNNQQAQSDLGAALMRAGMVELSATQREESLGLLRRAATIHENLLKRQPNSRRYAVDLATTLEFIGHRMRDLGKAREALGNYERSLTISRNVIAIDPMYYPSRLQILIDLEAIALLTANQGERTKALATAGTALDFAKESHALNTLALDTHLARAWNAQGATYESLAKSSAELADWQRACESFRRAADLWKEAVGAMPDADLAPEARNSERRYSDCQVRLAQATR